MNELNKNLNSFIDEILIQEGIFSIRNDTSLELPLSTLLKKGLELLESTFTSIINKGFKNEYKQNLEEIFINNINSIDSLCENLLSINQKTIKDIYIQKYEKHINNIKNNKQKNQINHFTVLVTKPPIFSTAPSIPFIFFLPS